MKVLLIDIDSVIPNLALKKLEKYYLDKGAKVIWNNIMFRNIADKIFVSCVFTKNRHHCLGWEGIATDIGGTGYSIKKKLPDEIDSVKPKINIGFTTRGCVRKCKFCFVPEKEGRIHAVGDLYDIWDRKSGMVTFLDNNATALKDHFIKVLRQVQKEKIKCEFNQGLDIRLLDLDMAKELKKTRLDDLYFAWDDIHHEKQVLKGLNTLKMAEIKRIRLYVLCGFNSTFQEDLYRLRKIRKIHLSKNPVEILPYCMLHENCYENGKPKEEYLNLRNWTNCCGTFYADDYTDYSKIKIRLEKEAKKDIVKLQENLF